MCDAYMASHSLNVSQPSLFTPTACVTTLVCDFGVVLLGDVQYKQSRAIDYGLNFHLLQNGVGLPRNPLTV